MSRIGNCSLIITTIFLLSMLGFGQGTQLKNERIFTLFVAPYIEIYSGPIDWSESNSVDFAYANCPFTVYLSGEKPGVNPAISKLNLFFNGREHDFADWTSGVAEFPLTRSYLEAPHNGQIKLNIYMRPGAPAGATPKMTITLSPF